MPPINCHSKERRLKYDHGLLINVVARISTRFERIAKDKTFWKGDVFLELAENTEDGPRFPISTGDAQFTLRCTVARCLDDVNIRFLMNHGASWLELDGLQYGVKTKVCQKCKCHKVVCSMVYSKEFTQNFKQHGSLWNHQLLTHKCEHLANLFRSLINESFGDGTRSLMFLVPMLVPPRGVIKQEDHPLISREDILTLAENCPNLRTLDDRRLLRLNSWPRSAFFKLHDISNG